MRRALIAIAALAMLAASSANPADARAPSAPREDASFFGQHLEDFPSQPGIATPPWQVKSIRLWDAGVTWRDLNPAPGQYDWSELDKWLSYAGNSGADLIYTFGDAPAWTTVWPQPVATNWGMSDRVSAFQAFLTALIRHARGRIKYFELWNEWDLQSSWADGLAPIVSMARAAGRIIHGTNQDLRLLTPSITTSQGVSALESFLNSIPPDSGVLDIVAVHTYPEVVIGHAAWPEEPLNGWIARVRDVMRRTGYGNYPLWSTEGSWGQNSSSFPGFNDPASQRAYVARYDLVLLSLGVSRAYWYAYANPSWGSLWSSYGLTPGGVAANELLKTSPTPGWLAGATLRTPCAKDSTTGVWSCDINRPGGSRGKILWVESGPQTMPRPAGYSKLRNLSGQQTAAPPQLPLTIEPILIQP